MSRKHLNKEIKISYSIRWYISVIFMVFGFLPLIMTTYLYETGAVEPGEHTLIAFLLLMLLILPQSARLVEYILISRNLSKATEFCKAIRQGNYMAHFRLPRQKEDENSLIDFLRNLELVATHIRGQNRQLMRMLHESKDKAQKMHELAVKDSLTGLYNRRYFDACIVKSAEQMAETGDHLSLLLLDCDNFKRVNDDYGHATGDRILRLLAETMLLIVRADKDIAFRFGGDEFGIIMPGADMKAAVKAANRLRGHYSKKQIFNTSLSISVSTISVDRSEDINSQIENLIIETDKGIYEVKGNNGNGISSREI